MGHVREYRAFYVLSGTARLVLGAREILVETGQAAEFATMTPHWIGIHGGPVEILSIFDLHGEKAHLRAPAARAGSGCGQPGLRARTIHPRLTTVRLAPQDDRNSERTRCMVSSGGVA